MQITFIHDLKLQIRKKTSGLHSVDTVRMFNYGSHSALLQKVFAEVLAIRRGKC
jgi:hypothetical protein